MKIICVGRNYAKHAQELNNPIPDDPVIFLKPDTALMKPGRDFYYPEFSKDIHFECEVVLKIVKEGKYISENFATEYIDSIGLGIDFTARDLQSRCKAKGLPWEVAKAFNDSAPVSHFVSPDELPGLNNLRFSFSQNGEVRQNGHTANLLFPIPFLISYVSRFFTLKKGDMIFTGTPAGVGPVKVGDHLTGFLEGEKMLDLHVR